MKNIQSYSIFGFILQKADKNLFRELNEKPVNLKTSLKTYHIMGTFTHKIMQPLKKLAVRIPYAREKTSKILIIEIAQEKYRTRL